MQRPYFQYPVLGLTSVPVYSITGQSSVPQASSSESSFITAVETPSPQYISEPPTAKPIHQLDGMALYSRYALAGAVCCSFTHAILTPVDM